jgi:hypothetical protein
MVEENGKANQPILGLSPTAGGSAFIASRVNTLWTKKFTMIRRRECSGRGNMNENKLIKVETIAGSASDIQKSQAFRLIDTQTITIDLCITYM